MTNRPVLGLDIDGTSGDFYPHFFRFAAGWLGKEVDPHGYELGVSPASYLGISKATYRQMKRAYRMGGMKRSMPVIPWMPDMVKAVYAMGAEVWICTTRPYLSHDNIDGDTRHWLRRNAIRNNGVLWGEHKYRDLQKTVGCRFFAALDDLPEMASQADQCGAYGILAERPHNKNENWCGQRAADMGHTLELIRGALESWRINHDHRHSDR